MEMEKDVKPEVSSTVNSGCDVSYLNDVKKELPLPNLDALVKQEDTSDQSCCLQIKSEGNDEKGNIKCETDDIYMKQQSLNEEVDIKTESDYHVRVDDTMKKPIKHFQCNLCNYKSSWKTNLQQHLKIHTGEKPFQCKICNFKCSRKSSLQRHIKIYTGEKPFQCKICNYKCSQKGLLQKHLKMHTGEKTFRCNVCSFNCSRKYYLQQHTKVHTPEKPVQCNLKQDHSVQSCSLQIKSEAEDQKVNIKCETDDIYI